MIFEPGMAVRIKDLDSNYFDQLLVKYQESPYFDFFQYNPYPFDWDSLVEADYSYKEYDSYLIFDDYDGLTITYILNEDEQVVNVHSLLQEDFLEESPLEEFRREITQVLRKHAIQAGSKHYTDQVIDPIAIAYLNDLSGPQLKVIKYVMRYKDKDGKKDLMKACDVLYKMLQYEYDVEPETIHAYCTGV